MEINIIGIVLTIIFASLAWYVNDAINDVPKLVKIVRAIILVVAVLCLLAFMGLYHHIPTTIKL